MYLHYKNTNRKIQTIQKRARHAGPHLHSTLEMIYVTEGTLELGIGQELYHLETGDLGIVFPEVIHHYQVFGEDAHKVYCVNLIPDNLYFSVSAGQLGKGLDEQLARFVAEHTDTKLIIIDTLQKVREVGGDNYSYANDYQIMARLKSFADAHCLCMLLVHHTRKQNADDKFDMISGTSGLLGAADGAFLLQKEKRTGNAATLEVSGRDQQDQKLYLVRNTETLLWDLQRAETELWKEPPEPLLDEIEEFVLKENAYWEGSATELASLV